MRFDFQVLAIVTWSNLDSAKEYFTFTLMWLQLEVIFQGQWTKSHHPSSIAVISPGYLELFHTAHSPFPSVLKGKLHSLGDGDAKTTFG